MKKYITNIRKSRFIIGLCIFGLLILGFYQLYNRNTVRVYLDRIEDKNIDKVMIVIDRFYDNEIELENIELIEQFKENITKFEWSISNQSFYEGDGNTFYNFELSIEDGSCSIFLIGKKYVWIHYFDQNQLDYKSMYLEVSWDEESYNRIVELVDESRELGKNK